MFRANIRLSPQVIRTRVFNTRDQGIFVVVGSLAPRIVTPALVRAEGQHRTIANRIPQTRKSPSTWIIPPWRLSDISSYQHRDYCDPRNLLYGLGISKHMLKDELSLARYFGEVSLGWR